MTVWETFQQHDGRLIDKWAHYFPIYERHFAKFVGQPVRVLEIGVGHGGSLQMWKRYFGKNAQIVGLDSDRRCADYEEPQIAVHIGDQGDPFAVMAWRGFDVVIDDGSHRPIDQQASFDVLWPRMKAGGVYLIEDCHLGYPQLEPTPDLVYRYPWVIVAEKPHRLVRGRPSRALNAAEVAAYGDLT